MLHDGMYMTDYEFLSNFWMDRACIHQLNELVENDKVFSNCWGKWNKWPSMLHIMLLLKYLGLYDNEASFQKIGRAMGISKGAVNECVMWSCSVILKLQKRVLKWRVKRLGRWSAPGLNSHMVLSIVLAWLMVLCFLWPLHPLWTWKIIWRDKVTMQLKVCLFVMILQRLLGLRWDGLAVYMTIWYGQRKSISATRIICLAIRHLLRHQLWFLLSKRATIPTWEKRGNNSTRSWRKCRLRANIV